MYMNDASEWVWRVFGFKELSKDYEWAASRVIKDMKYLFNVKHANKKYYVRWSFSHNKVTGAGQELGVFNNRYDVLFAVSSFLETKYNKHVV